MTVEQIIIDTDFLNWYYGTNEEARSAWELRMKEQPDLQVVSEEACLILDALLFEADTNPITTNQIQQSYEQLNRRIEKWEAKQTKKFSILSLSSWKWVAALLILSFSFWMLAEKKAYEELYVTDATTMQQIELEDGTIVQLNRNSTLKISDFTNNIREVWLTGEAYFNVKSLNRNEKFIVHTGEVNVEVVGTQFNVKGVGESTEVVLESGKVILGADGATPVVMEPGEKVSFQNDQRAFERERVKTMLYTNWKDEWISLEDATADELKTILSTRFGLEVEMKNDVQLGALNGVYPAQNPDVLLKAIEKAYDVQVHRAGNSVIIEK